MNAEWAYKYPTHPSLTRYNNRNQHFPTGPDCLSEPIQQPFLTAMRLQLLLLLALAYIAEASAAPIANGVSIRDDTLLKMLTEG